MLDEIELPGVVEISVAEFAAPGDHPGHDENVPVLPGQPSRLTLSGIARGPGADAFVGQLAAKYRAGKPATFVADIETDVHLTHMLIEDFRVRGTAGRLRRRVYILTLREVAAPPQSAGAAAVDEELLADATGRVQQLATDLRSGLGLMQQLSAWTPRLVALNRALEKQVGN